MTGRREGTDAYVADLADFVVASPSSFHAAAEVARRLDRAGFARLDELESWSRSPARGYVVRDGAVIAWALPPTASPTTPFRIVGAHTDSPGFMLKPRPGSVAHGWLQAGVEVYGGPLLNSWLDRELELAGRLVTRDGAQHLVRTGPLLRIPQLAIHLDRSANEGLSLDRQRHTVPVWGAASAPGGGADAADLVAHVAGLAGLAGRDVAGFDLVTADTQAPARFGRDDELLAAGRLDNLTSVHAGTRALVAAAGDQGGWCRRGRTRARPGRLRPRGAGVGVAVRCLRAVPRRRPGPPRERPRRRPRPASASPRGVLVRVGRRRPRRAPQLPRAPRQREPGRSPGGGPLLKVNATQRYATDAHGRALWSRVCAAAGVPTQEFVSNNTVPCGSTIGPLTATRLGIRVVDVGAPLLSMHSARELAHVDDLAALGAALEAYYRGA